MRIIYSETFLKELDRAPLLVQKAFQKQQRFLLQDLGHPSLRAKKYDEATNVWQARVNRRWRFYFLIEGDAYRLVDLIPHPK